MQYSTRKTMCSARLKWPQTRVRCWNQLYMYKDVSLAYVKKHVQSWRHVCLQVIFFISMLNTKKRLLTSCPAINFKGLDVPTSKFGHFEVQFWQHGLPDTINKLYRSQWDFNPCLPWCARLIHGCCDYNIFFILFFILLTKSQTVTNEACTE